ncbi:MAG: hypothetical protein HYZ92_00750 [Candidatus Omnitrophica bacterium]|nr:hypothetical protein [Candidatus Omnitrophota bacterium]
MREFASTKYRLKSAPLWQKRLYSACLAFFLVGLLTSAAFGLTKTGLSVQSIADYYRGNPERMKFEKTPQELLEVTHFHAFTMPVVLLILGHLFFLSDWPAGLKRIVVAVAAVSAFFMIATPWAIRYLDPGWAYAKWVAGYALGAAMLCLIMVPIYEMWFHH